MSTNPRVNPSIANIIDPQPVAPQPAPPVVPNPPQILPPAPNPHAPPIQDPNGTLTNPFVPGHPYNRMLGQQIADRIEYNNHVGWPSLPANEQRWLQGALAYINPRNFATNPTYKCSPNNISVKTDFNLKKLRDL